eukprot:2268561-Amphidinium_carterae.1
MNSHMPIPPDVKDIQTSAFVLFEKDTCTGAPCRGQIAKGFNGEAVVTGYVFAKLHSPRSACGTDQPRLHLLDAPSGLARVGHCRYCFRHEHIMFTTCDPAGNTNLE